MAQHLSVQEMFALEEGEVGCAIVFPELRLAVDTLVERAEEAIDQFPVLGRDALERLLLHLLELLDECLVYPEVACAVLPLITELLALHSAKGEQAGHVERGVHQDACRAPQLLGIEGPHAGGHDEGGSLTLHGLLQETHGLEGAHGDVGAQHRDAHRVEMVAHLGGRAAAASRGKSMQVENFLHLRAYIIIYIYRMCVSRYMRNFRVHWLPRWSESRAT